MPAVPDPTFRYEDWLSRGTDFVVFGEGDRTLVELTERLMVDGSNLNDIKGIAFKNPEITRTADKEFLTLEEFSQIPHPYYDETTKEHMTIVPIQLSRGCPYNCNFCAVVKMNGGKTRPQSSNWVIEELRRTKGIGVSRFYTDDNLYGNPKLIEVLEAISQSDYNNMTALTEFSVQAVKNERFLDALKNAKVDIACRNRISF